MNGKIVLQIFNSFFASKLEETCRALLSRFEGVTTWALSVCTVDGKRVALGDLNETSAMPLPSEAEPPDLENYFPLNELCYLLGLFILKF